MRQVSLINISLVITLLGLVFFITLVTYFLNKGFELSDESYYLLCTKYPFDTKLLLTSYGLVNHRFCFGINDLFSLRLFKLIYQLMFLGLFSRAFYLFAVRKLKCNSKYTLLLSLVLMLCGFSNYDHLPMTLSYNSWSLNFGLLFWSALLFASISTSKKGFALWNMIMGLAVALLFYSKAPNSIVLVFVFIVFTLMFQKGNVITSFLLFGLGKIAGIMILFLSYDAYKDVTSNILFNIFNARKASAYGYLTQFGEFVTKQPGLTFLFIQMTLVCLMYLFKKRNFNKVHAIKILLLNTLFVYFYLKGNSYNITNEFIVFFIVSINCLGMIVLLGNNNHTIKDNLIPLLLILSPFMLAAGTSNPIFYTSSQLFVFSLSGLFILLLRIDHKLMEPFYAYCSLFVFLVIASFLYHGMVRKPYRQTDLSDKKSMIPSSQQIKNISESSERVLIYNELSSKLKEHNSAHLPVLSSPSTLGALLLTDSKPFAVCWIGDSDDNALSNAEYFNRIDVRNTKPFLMIGKDMFNSEWQNKIFKGGGMDLKLDYVVVDSVYLEWNTEYCYLMQPVKNV